MRKETPNQYLDKYEQKPPDRETIRRIRTLIPPWAEVEYGDSGTVEVKHGDFFIHFDYQKTPKEISSKFVVKEFSKETYFELKNFEIQHKGRDVTRDVASVLPPEYKIYFSKSDGPIGYLVPGAKRIVLHGDPTSPSIFLALFHEIGHIYEQKQKKEFAPEQFVDRQIINVEDFAERMHSERDAWAFALKYLRQILDTKDNPNGLSRDATLAYAKNIALHSHMEGIKSDIAHRRRMAHFSWDYIDDFEDENWDHDFEDEEEITDEK